MDDVPLPLGLVQVEDEFPVHPAANLFPMLGELELAELAEDIRAKGLINPIILDAASASILDGRNRAAACRMASVEPRYETYTGDDPLGFVVSSNLRRRHLTAEQKREIIARVVKEQPERSDRSIGRLTQADGKTVAAVRAD